MWTIKRIDEYLRSGNIYSMPNFEQEYIPYEATARHIVHSDETLEPFLRALIPGVTNSQIQFITERFVEAVHGGITIGLDMSEGDDPLDVISAYQLGVKDGLDKRNEDY